MHLNHPDSPTFMYTDHVFRYTSLNQHGCSCRAQSEGQQSQEGPNFGRLAVLRLLCRMGQALSKTQLRVSLYGAAVNSKRLEHDVCWFSFFGIGLEGLQQGWPWNMQIAVQIYLTNFKLSASDNIERCTGNIQLIEPLAGALPCDASWACLRFV